MGVSSKWVSSKWVSSKWVYRGYFLSLKKSSMKRNILVVATTAILWSVLFHFSMADACLRKDICLQDIVTPPVNLSISGAYYTVATARQKLFTVDVSQYRFIKAYSDGITIVGIKVRDSVTYYIIDNNKKVVLKVSQTNLYKTGLFFNWDSITGLVHLPGNTPVTSLSESRDGCTFYNVADAGVKLCIDIKHHMPIIMEHNGITVAQVLSIKPLLIDLRATTDSVIQSCMQHDYTFIDVDADLDIDAD